MGLEITNAAKLRKAAATYVVLERDTAITADGYLVPYGHVEAVRVIGPAGRQFVLADAIRVGIADAEGKPKPFGMAEKPAPGQKPKRKQAPAEAPGKAPTKAELRAEAKELGVEVGAKATNAEISAAIDAAKAAADAAADSEDK